MPSRRSTGSQSCARVAIASSRSIDALMVPTAPAAYTVAELEADPIRSTASSAPTPISSTCSILRPRGAGRDSRTTARRTA